MKLYILILNMFLLALAFTQESQVTSTWLLPIQTTDRRIIPTIKLTHIGKFGEMRKARPTVPAHLHTGIDIKRPTPQRDNEPVFPAAPGRVLSIRNDGPFAQIIIEHILANGQKIWTAFEHISGIVTSVGQRVHPSQPIARFMNRAELDRYGWQFNHIHFEILKTGPKPVPPDPKHPERFFTTYNLECYSKADLNCHYHNPIDFFREQWNHNSIRRSASTQESP